MVNKNKMVQLCKSFTVPSNINVVIEKPYIPWVPDNWNGILVLAESQNLSKTNKSYVEKLQSLSDEEKILRLNKLGTESDLGIAPWDDGSLKLAVEAAFNKDSKQTAVSNAVMWSQVTESKTNINPSSYLMKISAELWSQLIQVLQPEIIITAGKIAQHVIIDVKNIVGINYEHVSLRLPAKTAMSRVSGMFNQDDLLGRYPKVRESVEKHPEWVKQYKLNKVYFACHAVSLYGKKN